MKYKKCRKVRMAFHIKYYVQIKNYVALHYWLEVVHIGIIVRYIYNVINSFANFSKFFLNR